MEERTVYLICEAGVQFLPSLPLFVDGIFAEALPCLRYTRSLTGVIFNMEDV